MTKKKSIKEKSDLLPIYKLKYEILSQVNTRAWNTKPDDTGEYISRNEIFLRFLDKSIDDNKEFYIKFVEMFGLREFYKVLYRYLSYHASKELGKKWSNEGIEFPEGSSRRASGQAMRNSKKLKEITDKFTIGDKPIEKAWYR